MQHNVKILRSDLPTYFIEKQRKLREMDAEAQRDADDSMRMLASVGVFALIIAVIALVYSFQVGWWR